MAECTQCGAYTKYDGGLCYKCYKKDGNNGKTVVAEKEVNYSTPPVSGTQKKKQHHWTTSVIKGRIAETIVQELFRSLGFEVYSYGMEHAIPGIIEHLSEASDSVAYNIRRMPDFVVLKDKRAHFIEVKYRGSGKLTLKDIEKDGPYPYEDALFVLVTKKHIKCISYIELKEGKEIHSKCSNFLGKRKEFDTDREKIIDYCQYATKFFENVD